MAIPAPGLWGVTGPATIAEDAICATVIVGNSAMGDIPNITCHVVDDIAAGIALLPATGGTVHIKRGTYNPAAAIVVPSYTTIQGEDRVIVNKPGAGLNLFELASGTVFVTIRNLRELNGQGDVNGGNLIDIDRSQDVLIENCRFENNPGNAPGVDAHGINITGTNPNQSLRITINRCRFDTMGRAIYAESTDAAIITVADIRVFQCEVFSSEKEGIYFLFTERTYITDSQVDGSGTSGAYNGIYLAGKGAGNRTRRHVMNGARSSTATQHGLEIEFCDESTLAKLNAYNNAGNGFQLTDADRNKFDGGVSTGNTLRGFVIDANSDRNIVLGYQLLGNTVGPGQDNGTNTDAAHNIIV